MAHITAIAIVHNGVLLINSLSCGEREKALQLLANPKVKEVSFLIEDGSGFPISLLLVKQDNGFISVYSSSQDLPHPKEYYLNPAVRAEHASQRGINPYLEYLGEGSTD